MNKVLFQKRELSINIKEYFWKLLQQWKLMIIVCLFFTLALSLVVFQRQKNEDKEYKEAKKELEELANEASAAEEVILSELSSEDRASVEYALRFKKLISDRQDYLNNSLLLDLEPLHVKTLTISYSIYDIAEPQSVVSIADGYAALVNNSEAIRQIGAVLAPDADIQYVKELVSISNRYSTVVGEGEAATVFITILIPDDADENNVAKTIKNLIQNRKKELSDRISDHNLKIITEEVFYAIRNDITSLKTDCMNWINTLKIYRSNAEAALTDQQKAAYDQIEEMTANADGMEEVSNDTVENNESFFSGKIAVIGVIAGIVLYAIIYFVVLIIRGKVVSASDAEYYTGSRVIGEIYNNEYALRRTDIVHSSFVTKFQNSKRRNSSESDIFHILEAICKKHDIKKCAELVLTNKAPYEKIVKSIKDNCIEKGIDCCIIYETNEINELEFVEIDKVVLFIGDDTKVNHLNHLLEVLHEYEIIILGTVFFGTR
ncbi:MAG: hypothetical protein IJJ06_09365 [Mogibacterium sp.]|nr:hypothetical protein [Mogibacterium sp.]